MRTIEFNIKFYWIQLFQNYVTEILHATFPFFILFFSPHYFVLINTNYHIRYLRARHEYDDKLAVCNLIFQFARLLFRKGSVLSTPSASVPCVVSSFFFAEVPCGIHVVLVASRCCCCRLFIRILGWPARCLRVRKE